MSGIVIYTDLDGSLLDHDSYSHAPADALLAELEADGIPVIPCSSKTRAELLPLREALHNRHPFVIENGAAVLIPCGYFDQQPDASIAQDDFWIRSFTQPRSHWLQLLDAVGEEFAGEFIQFAHMDIAQIIEETGLDARSAALAAQREFSEPVQWLGSRSRQDAFVAALQRRGARVLRGGRFLHVSGDCDKGHALVWLNQQYDIKKGARAPLSIAIGDSENDVAMLEAADYALIIRSPAHPPPVLSRRTGAVASDDTGPRGWNTGMRDILATIRST
jgi:mannosyl-3-phosphoglycerate phosphatase family protein